MIGRLIFLGGFWAEHIPSVRMVKFKLLAQFPVGHFTDRIGSNLIFFFALIYSICLECY